MEVGIFRKQKKMKENMVFKIFASMNIDSLEPWIWTNFENNSKGYITIKNKSNGKKIKCYKRTIDDNFLKIYNELGEGRISIDLNKGYYAIVMNEYYRNRLQIKTQEDCELSIEKSGWLELLFLNWYHPNPQVQYGNRMSVFSILLGLIALIATIKSIC